MAASSRATHFCRAVNTTRESPHVTLQAALAPARVNTRSPSRVTALRGVIGLLRRWRELMRSHPELRELDNHILKDIGLIREARRCEAASPFRHQWFSSFF